MVPGVTPRPSPGVGSPLSRAFVLSGSLHLCPWYVSWSLPRPRVRHRGGCSRLRALAGPRLLPASGVCMSQPQSQSKGP